MSHYSRSQQPGYMRKWARKAAKEFVLRYPESGSAVLCYTGMSGVAAATALTLALPRDYNVSMIYVRKVNEECHGYETEHEFNGAYEPVAVFVDDFIASGDTLLRVHAIVSEHHPDVIWDDEVCCFLTGERHSSVDWHEPILRDITRYKGEGTQ